MRTIVLALLALTAGCAVEPQRETMANTDIAAVADDAQGDIDTYAANALQNAPTRRAEGDTAAAPAAPMVAEATPQDAPADVVRRYYALVTARRFDQAWALWDNDGRASGMTAAQFAASFARYADYRATVGPPGRVEAGAGQRYVELPVQVTGTLVEGGRPFAQAGTLTLHRTADIDGATPAQRTWRISAASLRPAPPAPGATATPAGDTSD